MPNFEKRSNPRAKLPRKLRIRPSDFYADNFEEIATTVNVSKRGVYFHSEAKIYRVGMCLFVIYPFTSMDDPFKSEYFAEVVRINYFCRLRQRYPKTENSLFRGAAVQVKQQPIDRAVPCWAPDRREVLFPPSSFRISFALRRSYLCRRGFAARIFAASQPRVRFSIPLAGLETYALV